MGKREEVLSRKFFGELEVLGNSTFRSDYVQCLCSCGQICDINFYNILEGKRTCCSWCKSPKTVEARKIKTFSHLTVIGHGKSASDLRCSCACGNVKDIPALRLLNGDNKTCGCKYGTYTLYDQCLDIRVFGRLTVLSRSNTQGNVSCRCDCGNITKSSVNSLLAGETKSCGCLSRELSSKRMKDKATMKVGQTYKTTSGINIEVVEYEDCDNVSVKFPDGYVRTASAGSIRKGEVRNPYNRSVCEVGFLGEGCYTSKDKAYTHWQHMMHRCYTEKYGHTYDNAVVADVWHNYQNFAEWFYNNWKGNRDVALDKDILIKGNIIYSPDTCCLIPENLNNFTCKAGTIRGSLPIGVRTREYENYTRYTAVMFKFGKLQHLGEYSSVIAAFNKYKLEKEKHAKLLADKYLSEGLICEKIKTALYNYKVDITD